MHFEGSLLAFEINRLIRPSEADDFTVFSAEKKGAKTSVIMNAREGLKIDRSLQILSERVKEVDHCGIGVNEEIEDWIIVNTTKASVDNFTDSHSQ